MVKRRPGVSILPLMLIVILCVSWLTQLNQRDEMTYDEMVQLFEQQKVEAFRFTDSSTLMLQVKGSDQPVRCRIHDYTLFYSDLNDLVKEQKAAGIIKSYSYPPPEGTDWLGIMLPYLMFEESRSVGGSADDGADVRRYVVPHERPGTGRHGAGPDGKVWLRTDPWSQRKG